MIILLPKSYVRKDKDGNIEAEIIDGILYIYRVSSFKDIMIELSYKIYGNKCCYCHKNVANSIDHGIPQDFGGPYITDNLYPSCKKCNSRKTNMFEDEFLYYLSLPKNKRKEYVESLKEKQEKRREGKIKSLPSEWLLPKETRSSIKVRVDLNQPLGVKYAKLLEFYNTYGRFKAPVIISENGYLLDGFNIVLLSKFYGCKNVDQILLENVVVKERR